MLGFWPVAGCYFHPCVSTPPSFLKEADDAGLNLATRYQKISLATWSSIIMETSKLLFSLGGTLLEGALFRKVR